MSKNIALTSPLILEEIKKAKHILLHCHPSPDPDSVGSALAMKLALEQLGKKVTLIQGDSSIPNAFKFPGVETIAKKSFLEIDINDFDLFIILDGSNLDRVTGKEKISLPETLSTILIDHHRGGSNFAKINLVDPTYAATAQILFDLFKEIGVKIDHDIALNLFMGIYTDTGAFRYGTSPETTLKIAAELAQLAPDYPKTIFVMENSNRMESLIFEGLALSSVKTFYGGKFSLVSVDYEKLHKNNINESDILTGYIANKLKSVIGLDVCATLIEATKHKVKVSFRTRDENKYDLSKLAISLGGGGHKGAAGVILHMTMEEAIDKVVKQVKEIYNL